MDVFIQYVNLLSFLLFGYKMAYLQKVRSFFATIVRQCSYSRHTEPSHSTGDKHEHVHPSTDSTFHQEPDDSDDDPYAALSEVAAPEPVKWLSEAELIRHPSLEQGIVNSRGDPYWNLSEVAAPEPIEKLTEEDMARHPSLERRLSMISHH